MANKKELKALADAPVFLYGYRCGFKYHLLAEVIFLFFSYMYI